MAVSEGPSGKNFEYLSRLDRFLEETACPKALAKFDDTFALTAMAQNLKGEYDLYFLFGAGSNQHDQLLMAIDENVAELSNGGEDAHELKDIVLCCARPNSPGDLHPERDLAVKVFAGGGHSGVLTETGRLYLFGWNDDGQLGRHVGVSRTTSSDTDTPLPVHCNVENILVKDASLGFSHTLVIEKGTGRLFAFGDNCRGQVTGVASSTIRKSDPFTPHFLVDEKIVNVASGLFHSAVITSKGEVITFGCARFGQSLPSSCGESDNRIVSCGRRWMPPDGSKLVKVACGRRHTILLDERGRVWSFGENKFGQLGRPVQGDESKSDASPKLVVGCGDMAFSHLECGWSHNVALSIGADGKTQVYGWGRNDKGQLGTGSTVDVPAPVRIFSCCNDVQTVTCGSESTIVLDCKDTIWSTGWNEHGNLSTGDDRDCIMPTKLVGARITRPPGYSETGSWTCIAAGGSHLLAMKVVYSSSFLA